MLPLVFLQKVFLYGILFLSTAAAVGVVGFRNIFHSALCLVGTLVGVAILYLALEAEFIAVVQILLYVGAVMTVVIFAIMLTHRLGDQTIPQTNKQNLPAFLVLLAFVALVGSLVLNADWGGGDPTGRLSIQVDALALGKALLGPYVFPFEVVSIVLIAGLIGAVVIARKD